MERTLGLDVHAASCTLAPHRIKSHMNSEQLAVHYFAV